MIYIVIVALGILAFLHDFVAKKINMKYIFYSLFIYPILAIVFLLYDVVKVNGVDYSYLFLTFFVVIFVANLKLWLRREDEK